MRKLNRKCEICDATFYVSSYFVEKGQGRFCSKKCAGLARSKKVSVICETCGTKFFTKLSQVKVGGRKYCSNKCAYVGHSKALFGKRRKRTIQICEICGKEFETHQCKVDAGHSKFCSNECRWKNQSNVLSGENCSLWKGGLVTINCKMCGKEFQAKPSRIKKGKKFCSTQCSGKFKSLYLVGEKSPAWMGGVSFDPYPIGWKDELKRQIRERDGNKCFLCGKTDENKKPSVHHIDYDKNNLSPRNLVSLCNSCHTKTNTNRENWIITFDTLCDFRRM